MTIEVDVHPYEFPLRTPFRTAGGPIERRRGFAVRIRAGKCMGVGEAAPLPGWTESYTACRQAIEAIAEQSPGRVDEINLPRGPAARHATQGAALDLAARRADQPLVGYLCDRPWPDAVPVNATVGNEPTPTSVRVAREAVDEGFGTIKCKVGDRPPGAEVERIAAIREAVDDAITLRLDANRAWTPEEAARLWPAFADADVTYVEEPLAEPSPEAFAALDRTAVGIAIDETANDPDRGLEAWWSEVDAVVIKPMALGGLDRALARSVAAIGHGVRPVISGTIDGVLARTAGIHLAATLPESAAAGLATGDMLGEDLAAPPTDVRGGRVGIPTGGGIGTAGPWSGGGA